MKPSKPLTPIRPSGIDIVYFYTCPFCDREVPLLAPVQPTMARCDSCNKNFPVVPADARTIAFIKLMTAEGKAGVDPDFV